MESRGKDIPNKPNEYSTFKPRNAGNLNFKKFIIVFNSPATAPGFVTRSFRLGTRTFMPAFSATCAPLLRYLELSPCFSAAAARTSGPMEVVILAGSFLMRSWRKGEVLVGALELVFRVGEEGFEVVVGSGDAVHEVFEDEGESVVCSCVSDRARIKH